MTLALYSKSGAGIQSGISWADAKPLSYLAIDIRSAVAGDEFLVGFDRNREDPVFWSGTGLTIDRSGSEDAPLSVKAGYISHADDVQVLEVGSSDCFFRRSGYSGKPAAEPNISGDPYVVLNNDASFVHLSGFACFGAPASGLIRIGEGQAALTHTDISIRNLNVTRAGRAIESSPNCTVERLIVEDCTGSEIVRGFARFRSVSNSVFRNLVLDGGNMDGGGVNVCQFIHAEAGHDLLFENVWMRNAVNGLAADERGSSSYVQGDGIVCEEATRAIIFRNCHAAGMGDGGFDLKTDGFLFEHGSAHGCKKGMRVWSRGDNRIVRSHFGGPRKTGGDRGSCIWCAGTADLLDCSFQAGPDAAIFAFGESTSELPRIRVFGGEIRTEGGAALLIEQPGILELHDVAVNGTIRNEIITSQGGTTLI